MSQAVHDLTHDDARRHSIAMQRTFGGEPCARRSTLLRYLAGAWGIARIVSARREILLDIQSVSYGTDGRRHPEYAYALMPLQDARRRVSRITLSDVLLIAECDGLPSSASRLL